MNTKPCLFFVGLGILLVVTAQAAPPAKINTDTWLNPHVSSMKADLHGPFVRLDEKRILVFDKGNTRISSDAGQTWSPPRAVFTEAKKYQAASPAG